MSPDTGRSAMNAHARLLLDSYRRWTGRPLLEEAVEAGKEAARLFHASIIVLSHGTQADPILNFGNRAALELWEMDWDTLVQTPSRLTAEPMEREERARFLQAVSKHGYVDNYTGIRISSTGRRFYIKQATVWNLTDEAGAFLGQAASFRDYQFTDEQ